MNLFAFRKNIDVVLHPVVNALARLPLHANTWTMLGAALGLVGGALFFYAYWWSGFAVLLVRGLVDHIDGFKARNFNQRSTFGAVDSAASKRARFGDAPSRSRQIVSCSKSLCLRQRKPDYSRLSSPSKSSGSRY